jgi:vitamin B12 transporter
MTAVYVVMRRFNMKNLWLASSALLTLAAVLPTSAIAQDRYICDDDCADVMPPAPAPENRDLGATLVVTGTRIQQQDVPVSFAVLDAQRIQRLQLPSVVDLLARLPGVTATRNGPIGGFAGVRIRGADAAQTLVVIDGVRVNDPSSPSGGFDFGSLLSGNIRRIDVLRGSNSVAWASDAIGGVVLVETGGRPGVSGEYGSFDTARIDGNARASIGPLNVSGGAGWFRTDGISAARNGTEADGFRQYRGNARLGLEIGGGFSGFATVLVADSRLEIDGFTPPTFAFGDTAEYQDSQEIYAAAGLQHGIGRFRQQLTYAVADINRDSFDPAAGASPTFAARGRSERIVWQAEWSNLTLSQRIVGGIDREWTRSTTADAFSQDRGATARSGVFLTGTTSPFDGLQIGAGIRYDDHQDFGGNTSLSGNVLFNLSDAVALRASYAEGFKAPTLFQLSPTPTGFGNPVLQPEQSRSYDVGIVYRNTVSRNMSAPIGIQVTASLFRRDSRDLIDFVSCFGLTAPPICGSGNRPFGTYANVDRARAEGGEVEIRLMPSARLSVTAGYAYTSTRDRLSGNRLARRPLHTAIFGADYQSEGFSLGGDVQLVGDSFDDAGNFTRLDSYALVNVRGTVALSWQVELYGRVENLFDADYQNVAGYGTYGRTFAAGIRARF